MLRRTMLAGLASFTVLGACSSSGGDSNGGSNRASRRDLADVVAREPDLGLLQQWIDAADYTRLRRPGPFTLFAPNDNALGELRPAMRGRLMRPDNRDLLRAVLDHHVVAGRLSRGELRPRTPLRTIDGEETRITHQGQSWRFGTGNLVRTNIEANNGIIHVIDKVQFPPNLNILPI